MISMSTITSPPEAAGPGTDDPSGLVRYGVPGPRAVIAEDTRPLREPVRNPRCDRCRDLPDEVVRSLTAAIRATRQGRPL